MFTIHCAPAQYWEEKCPVCVARAVRSVGTLMGEAGAGGKGSWQSAHSSDTALGACAPSVAVSNRKEVLIYIPGQRGKKNVLECQSDKFSAFLYWGVCGLSRNTGSIADWVTMLFSLLIHLPYSWFSSQQFYFPLKFRNIDSGEDSLC